MTDPTRRRALLGLGTIASLSAAGCLGPRTDENGTGTDDPPGTDPGETPGDETPTDQPDPPEAGPVTRVGEHAVAIGLPADSAAPRWTQGSGSERDQLVGAVARFNSRGDAQWVLEDLPDGPERTAAIRTFIEETEFENATIIYVGSGGPNTCYAALDVQDIRTERDAIVGNATAIDTSRGDVGCGEAITYPASLIRVTEHPLPADTRITVQNGWGEEATLNASEPLIDPATLDGRVRPTTDPPAKPDGLTCSADPFTRHPSWFDDEEVTYGAVAPDDSADRDGGEGESAADTVETAFAMRARGPEESDDSLRFERGETITIELVNVSGQYRSTGNQDKYAIEVHTTDGWMDVRGSREDPARFAYTDEAVGHSPGEGFEWSIEMTEEGIVAGHPLADRLTVCPDLKPGRYRFVYWGVVGRPIAVAFDLIE